MKWGMRIRRHRRKKVRETIAVEAEPVEEPNLPGFVSASVSAEQQECLGKEKRKSSDPLRLLRQVVKNPEFSYQAFIILMTLANDNPMRVDQKIASAATTIEKVKSATEVIGTTMRSLHAAAEAPRHIRKLFE